jgi:hypothetical protein
MPNFGEDPTRHAVLGKHSATCRIIVTYRLAATIVQRIVRRGTAPGDPLGAALRFLGEVFKERDRSQQWIMLGMPMPTALIPRLKHLPGSAVQVELPASIDAVAAQVLTGEALKGAQIWRNRSAGSHQAKQSLVALLTEAANRIVDLVRDPRFTRLADFTSIISQRTNGQTAGFNDTDRWRMAVQIVALN